VLFSCWHPMVYTAYKQTDVMHFLLTSRTGAGMRERFYCQRDQMSPPRSQPFIPEGQPPAAGLNPRDDYRSLTAPLADR
jgi:hypothetical protein